LLVVLHLLIAAVGCVRYSGEADVAAPGLTDWYDARSAGIEQGFTRRNLAAIRQNGFGPSNATIVITADGTEVFRGTREGLESRQFGRPRRSRGRQQWSRKSIPSITAFPERSRAGADWWKLC
jgi:hypothetical protein